MTLEYLEYGGAVDVAAEAQAIVTGLVRHPWGQLSPSVYETGRLVTLAPWLDGHRERVRFLLAGQRPDGGWGGPGGYALVPTLSATEALLTSLGRTGGAAGGAESAGGAGGDRMAAGRAADDHVADDRAVLAAAAGRALRMLSGFLPCLSRTDIPDMPALDLIAPYLIGAINRHLDRFRDTSPEFSRSPVWPPVRRLPVPAGVDGGRLPMIEAMLSAGAAPPEKLLHALEVAGEVVRGAPAVGPGPVGVVGASPAATAAWLDEPSTFDPDHPARRFLEAVAGQHGGPVPCGIPVPIFERAWVLTTLVRAGIEITVPAELTASLEAALAPDGTAAGEGLPPDADTTSAALYTLGLTGAARSPESLRPYERDTHFCTWPGEDGLSVSVNAHVLEAFGEYLTRCPDTEAGTSRDAAARVVTKLCTLLRERQRTDGSWCDRWHASPYYATACCVLALNRFGGAEAVPAVHAAVAWVLATQRADGSWGRWGGTAEETAYALHILLAGTGADTGAGVVGADADQASREAVAAGHAYLLDTLDALREPDNIPPLWHDKDLYRPTAIVRAAVLAAIHLTERKYAADTPLTTDFVIR